MSELTLKERFEKALKGKALDIVPVCSVTQTGTVELMEMTGSYWPQANYKAASGSNCRLHILRHEWTFY